MSRAQRLIDRTQACPAFWRARQARIARLTATVQAELARRGLDDSTTRGGPPLRACADCGAAFRSFRLDRCNRCRGYAHTRAGGER